MKEGLDINPDRWPDVSRLFSATAALDGSSRNAYLDEACGQDPALRAAVESLLAAHDNAGSFGEAPLVAPLGAAKRLAPGTQLGPFRIETWLGAGGMGEVYRASDTKLQRAVAIKVLPDFFAQDPNRLARFEEEARALAALNHPHVGAIYGLEESAGVAALVLELVEGPTLAERLAAGPLAFDEVVWITRQLAEGLEAAHERGIVHRDLKPGNIKITPEGNVKILDFGLAKIAGSPPGTALTPSTASPRDATQFGVVLGTVGYMSPEQARGQAVDKRTDIWAFGCVLFEMCAHQPPFAGATISDAQAAVIEREPDWQLLRAGTPANLVRLLRRCLTKDSKLRLRDIGEARIALERDADTSEVTPRSTTRRVAAIAAILAALASFAIAFAIFGSGPSVSLSPDRFDVPPPEGGSFSGPSTQLNFALSPDGSRLAFSASNRAWTRVLSEAEAQPLTGTENASGLAWSPDGLSLAFFAGRQLKRINLRGGAVVPICDAAGFSHVTWGNRDVILMGRADGTSIDAVRATGGTPVQVLRRNQSKGEARVGWPWFLPDGSRFLYTVRLDVGEGEVRLAQLAALDDPDGTLRPVQVNPTTLINASSNAQWVTPDVVVFVREGVLLGQRVDLEGGRFVADPFPIADGVNYFFHTGRAAFSASWTGSIAYHTGGPGVDQLVLADRDGNEEGTIGRPGLYEQQTARFSPDDRAVLAARSRPSLGTFDIWRIFLDRQNAQHPREQQLTSQVGNESGPIFIDDGRAIIFSAESAGSTPHLFRQDLATTAVEPALPLGVQQRAMDVFPDGRVIYVEEAVTTVGGARVRRYDLFQRPLARGAAPQRLPLGDLSAWQARLSPDGRAITFVPNNLVSREVYISTVPATKPPELVANKVLGQARWSRKGDRIYYVTSPDRTMMTRTVSTVPRLTLGPEEPLFKLSRIGLLQDVSLDGRFLLLVPLPSAGRPIAVWTNAIAATRR